MIQMMDNLRDVGKPVTYCSLNVHIASQKWLEEAILFSWLEICPRTNNTSACALMIDTLQLVKMKDCFRLTNSKLDFLQEERPLRSPPQPLQIIPSLLLRWNAVQERKLNLLAAQTVPLVEHDRRECGTSLAGRSFLSVSKFVRSEGLTITSICFSLHTHTLHTLYFLHAGPENWKNLQGYSACGGQKQSPIDIATSKAEYRESLGLFSYTGYNTNPSSMTLVNNGHTGKTNRHHSASGTSHNEQMCVCVCVCVCFYVCVFESHENHEFSAHDNSSCLSCSSGESGGQHPGVRGWAARRVHRRPVPLPLGRLQHPGFRAHHQQQAIPHGGWFNLHYCDSPTP